MMQVSNVNAAGTAVQAPKEQISTAEDSVSKEIQGKITAAQKRRQELSSNAEMTAEEKADRRQKIQQEISDLKRELRRRQLEEQKKQQEEEKAAKAKKEQKENASKEAVKERQKTESAQGADGRQQESMSGSQSSKKVDGSKAEEDVRESLPGVMHKSLSTEATVNQISILTNAAARADGTARVREAEINQDAARGTDVTEPKKAQRAELEKETRRMERIQAFMFGGSSKAAEADVGVVKQTFGGVRGKGLYNNEGMMFKTNFQSVQMDLKQ
jgi:hypothetical protein